jgi:2-C-methyl-D-erythritol 4-phosphate cytidylyltransferase
MVTGVAAMKETVGVVIVAAGRGSRMGTAESKQYLEVGNKPILVHTLELFQGIDEIADIVLVVGSADVQRCTAYVDKYRLTKVLAVISGGEERQDSVRMGLNLLPEAVSWVLVHDGVRPFAAREHVVACLREAQRMDAAVLAVPVKDTIKVVDAEHRIASTPERKSLWAIQTPQAFRLSVLREAHERAVLEGFIGTDDAMLVERIGREVKVVEGDYYNIKITTPEDLPWAEWICRHVRGDQGK